MGLVPEITGIGDQINPARLTARAVAINMKRERHFPGQVLQFFEKTATSDVEMLGLTDDWCATRVVDQAPGMTSPANKWKFEIIDTVDLTDGITNKTAFMKIGDLTFKPARRKGPGGNGGVWVFETELM